MVSSVSRMKNVIFHCKNKNIIHSHCIALLRCLFWIHKTSSAHAPGSTKGNLSWNNYFKRVSLNSQPCPQPFSLQMCKCVQNILIMIGDEMTKRYYGQKSDFQLFPIRKQIPAVFSADPPYLTTLRELWNCSCNA